MLKTERTAHAVAEARFFCLPLIAHDMTQEPSRRSMAEYHQTDKLVETLESADPGSPAWLAAAKALHHKAYHHPEDGHRRVFQMAEKVPGEDEKQSLVLALAYQGEVVSRRLKA